MQGIGFSSDIHVSTLFKAGGDTLEGRNMQRGINTPVSSQKTRDREHGMISSSGMTGGYGSGRRSFEKS